MPILTHDRIKADGTQTGVLAPSKGILWGKNALQSITINRNTPKNPFQAVGFLGIVDYGSGAITSDVAVEAILVEGCSKAILPAGVGVANSSIYRYAKQAVTLGQESYVLTGFSISFSAGNPASVTYNWLTSGLASYLDSQDQPDPGVGEESDYAVVLGDDGSGTRIIAAWDTTNVTPSTGGYIPVLDAAGVLQNSAPTAPEDSGLPAGVQSINMNASINRDQALDVRTNQPVQFITTYPLDMTVDMEVYEPPREDGAPGPGDAGWDPENAAYFPIFPYLNDIQVEAHLLTKHRGVGPAGWTAPDLASEGDVYAKAVGLVKVGESESVNVGSYLSYTVNFLAADIVMPLAAIL